MSEMFEQAKKKLDEQILSTSGSEAIGVMKKPVCDALIEFCEQDDEFAQAVVQGGNFADCMKAVANNAGNSISDLEAYRRAVQFYFPGADIHFSMSIDLCASVGGSSPASGSGVLISLDAFF